VSWPKNGWPVVNGNGTATLEMNTPTLPLNKSNEKPAINNFDSENLGLE
jgi:alpha-N-arabinofuranosidase